MIHRFQEHLIATIVIPTHCYQQRHWMVTECLAALSRQTVPKETFEVLVVNNSPKENAEWERGLKDFSEILNLKILHESMRGSYAARNLGARVAQGRVLAFIDSDCTPKPDWLECGIALIKKVPSNTVLGGRIIRKASSDFPNYIERHEKIFSLNQRQNILAGQFVATANLIVLKKVFFNIGLFNEKLVASGDVEWSFRARKRGCQLLFSSKACVDHRVVSDFSSVVRRYRRKAGGHYALKKNHTEALIGKSYSGYRAKKITSFSNLFFCSVSLLRFLLRGVQFWEKVLCRFGKQGLSG